MTLAERLSSLRKRKGATRHIIASEAQLSMSYLFCLETGVYKDPTLGILNRLARAYGLSVCDLLKGVDSEV